MFRYSTFSKSSSSVSTRRYLWRAAPKQVQSIKMCLTVRGEWQIWGSVATLFRQSWKILSYFVANLSKTLHIKCYQNRSSIVEVMTKKFGVFSYAQQYSVYGPSTAAPTWALTTSSMNCGITSARMLTVSKTSNFFRSTRTRQSYNSQTHYARISWRAIMFCTSDLQPTYTKVLTTRSSSLVGCLVVGVDS